MYKSLWDFDRYSADANGKKKSRFEKTSTLRSRISNYILAVFNLLFLHIERKLCACMFVCVTVRVSLCSPTEISLARAVAASAAA